ncbi:MAG: ABC transporter ATP-binding protein, partial [SAR324 cluster bacterium]|nr:ABC transporter ATP-binding protein [SAR324 cluster bacterium]
RDAIGLGIGMVHQHFQLVPVMTVVENVMLGSEMLRHGFLDREQVSQRILDLSRDYQLEVEPSTLVEDLPVGIRQWVEILKALYRDAEILILDEPTAVLTPQEIEGLFEVMDLLRRQGKSIIFITHKLKEVLRIADRIAVLRQGKLVGEVTPSEASEPRLAAMMVGREVMLQVDKKEAKPGDSILEVKGLEARNDLDEICLREVDLKVNAGEIVGVAGVQGNGQTELVEVLTGLRPHKNGILRIGGHDLSRASPREITDRGKICHVPEDRHSYGMVDNYSVADNLVLNSYYRSPFAKGMTIQRESIDTNAEALVKKFDVRTPSVQAPGASLSGGNQQKMVIARELSRPIQLMIAAQPTRGIDVGSIEFIHQQIVAKRDEGIAVLL